jgi:MOSC domain-containing protein YiiM
MKPASTSSPADPAAIAFRGRLEAIHLIAVRGGEPTAVDSVVAVAGDGLVGDRYFGDHRGPRVIPADQREVTLIEAEALDAVGRDHGLVVTEGASRRNLVTRGVALNHLVGVHFAIGGAVLVGQSLCEPCTRLARLASRPLMKALVHRGGLRARIVTGAEIRVGDPIALTERAGR